MPYRISGLDPAPFRPLFELDEAALAARGAVRRVADAHPGYPCRVSLRDAQPGERLILLNYVSHDVAGPFRTAYAIFVRAAADAPAHYEDRLPPVMAARTLGLRGFDAEGMFRGALLVGPGEAEAGIRTLFGRTEITSIHAHNAAHGCFIARVDRN